MIATIQLGRVVLTGSGQKVKDILNVQLVYTMGRKQLSTYKSGHVSNQFAFGALNTCATLAYRFSDWVDSQ